MPNDNETLYAVALTMAGRYFPQAVSALYNRAGSATAVYECRRDIKALMPDAAPRLATIVASLDDLLPRAEAELQYNAAHGIDTFTPADAGYPSRLRDCADSPVVLFARGTASLNARHVISIVGTRHATTYSRDAIHHFLTSLRAQCPDVLVVSGLAYGVDILAHRESLDVGYDTVGVLAHGLDTIYPSAHRATASEMIAHGALLTEFPVRTNADKQNFVRRNRIVAGMSDACILVESAAKGGGLITAGMARSYGREVFAFPGYVGRDYSEGCNRLIRDHRATLLMGADDFVEAMGWQTDKQLDQARRQGIERQLFPELTDVEQRIVDCLSAEGDMHVNSLAAVSGLPVSQITSAAFSLELKGVAKVLAGNVFHLL